MRRNTAIIEYSSHHLARPAGYDAAHPRKATVQTLDEMLARRLLSAAQHAEIGAWIAQAKTPEAILQMPDPLWRTLSLASVLMNLDADLTQPPLLAADG